MRTYVTEGVCSQLIDFSIDEEGRVHSVAFTGGCDGNLKAISRLVEGQDAKTVISLLEGNTCGRRSTSCADQLACALKDAIEE